MALTTTEEQLVRQLLAEQAALLSLASSESEILSNLGGDQATLSDLTAATSLADADLMLVRQGTTDKSVTGLKVKELAQTGVVLQSAFTGSNVSLTGNGYQKLPSGLIIQWGQFASSGATQTVNFPVSFTTSVFSVVFAGFNDGLQANVISMTPTSPTLSNFSARVFNAPSGSALVLAPLGGVSVRFIAIGY